MDGQIVSHDAKMRDTKMVNSLMPSTCPRSLYSLHSGGSMALSTSSNHFEHVPYSTIATESVRASSKYDRDLSSDPATLLST